jgi:hypothetical protein
LSGVRLAVVLINIKMQYFSYTASGNVIFFIDMYGIDAVPV